MSDKYVNLNDLRNALYEADAVTMRGVAIINGFPAADVVPVVRCSECKHLCVRSGALGVYQCAIHGDYPSGEYFCADGERKEGEKDKC